MNVRSMLCAALLLSAACAPRHAITANPGSATILAGQKLFGQHCAACHGETGMGTRYAPNLHSRRVQSKDAEWMFRFITNGDLRDGMPSWSRLAPQRRWQIVAYLKTLTPPVERARRGSSW